MLKIIKTLRLLPIIIVIMLFSISLYFWKSADNSKIKINTSRAAVIKEIKNLSRLETIVFSIEKIIDAGTDSNIFQDFLFGDKILLIAHGQVIAGIDFSKLNDSDLVIEDKKITITLPKSEIFISALDETKTEVYDRSQGLLTKGNKDLESKARAAAQESIREAACEKEILVKAAENAETQLTALLKGLGFEEIKIEAIPGSC